MAKTPTKAPRKAAAAKGTATKAVAKKAAPKPSPMASKTQPRIFNFGAGVVGTSSNKSGSSSADGAAVTARFVTPPAGKYLRELTDNGYTGAGGVMLCFDGTANFSEQQMSVFFTLLVDALAGSNGSAHTEVHKGGKTQHRLKATPGFIRYPLLGSMVCSRHGTGAYDIAVEVFALEQAKDIWRAVYEAYVADTAAHKHFSMVSEISNDITMPSPATWDTVARVFIGTLGYIQTVDGQEMFIVQGETIYRDDGHFAVKGIFGASSDIKELLAANDMTWRNVTVWNRSSGESVDILADQGMMMFPRHLQDAIVALFASCCIPLALSQAAQDAAAEADEDTDAAAAPEAEHDDA